MYRRQKIRINERERWISFKSTQDLVDKVLEYYVAEVQGDGVLVEKYLMDWFESYKEPMLERNTANNYLCMIKNHILPVIGKKPVERCSEDYVFTQICIYCKTGQVDHQPGDGSGYC